MSIIDDFADINRRVNRKLAPVAAVPASDRPDYMTELVDALPPWVFRVDALRSHLDKIDSNSGGD